MLANESRFRNLYLALKDIRDGICSIYIWPKLGWEEIKQRYRRSTLGPFWLTISTAVMICGMGPLFARLLGQPISNYFSFLAISFVVWLLISNLITDACQVFIGAEAFIKQIKMPLTVHILRMVWRNLIIFAHNFIIVVIVLLIYRPDWNWQIWLMPLGLLMIVVNGVWLGLLLALFCARFRDIPQVIASLVQIAFFLTPVMWRPEMLGRYEWTVNLNPLFHFIEIVRAPLLGEPVRVTSWVAVVLVTAFGYALALAFFCRFRARIAYWV